MEQNSTYFKIGVFVIAGTILGVICLVVLGAGVIFRKEILVETYFDRSVQGLDIGSAVKYRGIAIGNVKNIRALPQKYGSSFNYVMVEVALFDEKIPQIADNAEEKLAESVKNGLRFQMAPLGITGTMFLEADFLPDEKIKDLEITWKPDTPYIPSAPNTIAAFTESIDRILRNLEKINLAGITEKVETLLSTINEKFSSMDVKEINKQLTGLQAELRETNTALKETVGSKKVKQIIDDTGAITADVRKTINNTRPAVEKAVEDVSLAADTSRKAAESAHKALERLPEILDRLDSLTRRFDGLSSEKSPALSEVIDNIKKISENLEDLSRNAKEYPSQVIFGNPPEKNSGEK
jgi:phospholipid/cholesterol/gamma-HCH transport system substrate-binding protein/paraquat-inducible protein B